MGAGGSRTLKAEITDPSVFRTMIRNEKDGIYRLPIPDAAIPATPKEATGGGTLGPKAGDIDEYFLDTVPFMKG